MHFEDLAELAKGTYLANIQSHRSQDKDFCSSPTLKSLVALRIRMLREKLLCSWAHGHSRCYCVIDEPQVRFHRPISGFLLLELGIPMGGRVIDCASIIANSDSRKVSDSIFRFLLVALLNIYRGLILKAYRSLCATV